jgi:flagellar biosynthesis/type III secretory pathway protein FliH
MRLSSSPKAAVPRRFAENPGPGRTSEEGTSGRAPESNPAAPVFLYPEVTRTSSTAWAGEPDLGENPRGNLSASEERLQAAVREGEERARAWYDGEIVREREALQRALDGFARQRDLYFQNVEREAVQLTLLIARKVLEREARVDPLAVAAMVHVALEPLQTGTAVTLRVHPAAAQDWRLFFASRGDLAPASAPIPMIVEDGSLAPGDCVVVTAMGTAEISLRHKLEEIEASFLELLAQRPQVSV